MAAYDDLITFVASQGIPEAQAKIAVRRCLASMTKHGIATYAGAGAVAYFMNMNPASAMGFAALSLGGGAAYGLATSPQCSEVRTAVDYWTKSL